MGVWLLWARLEKANPALIPGSDNDRECDNVEALSDRDASVYRAFAARLNYLASEIR